VEQSTFFTQPWLWLALCLLAGIVIGLLLARLLSGHRGSSAKQFDELQERFDGYQREVVGHFNTTASLVKKLTQSYQEVQEHLSEGANRLATDDLTRQRLLAAINSDDTSSPRERLSLPKNVGEAPKDYAPKAQGETGMLAEAYGLQK